MDFVMFRVSDLRTAVAFYRGTLGLRCELESLEYQWAEFDAGNVTLALKGEALPAGARGGGDIALAVVDVQAACDELRQRGIAGLTPPEDSGFCFAVELHDPDGNRIILHQRTDGTAG
ncbi:MAG TPA: VOC family protein [Opitutaceae bacterium]|nr:VOC family protein [Opitutaceae bacterium]